MNRRSSSRIALALALVVGLGLAGCDYSPSKLPPEAAGAYDGSSSSIPPAASAAGGGGAQGPTEDEAAAMRPAILESVLSLIDNAALKPGGDSFKQAISKLNTYFTEVPAERFALNADLRTYLSQSGIPAPLIEAIGQRSFDMPETRHVEDCMMYHGIATRTAGAGDDLERVGRVFDWMIRQVQLVPPLKMGPAQARPYDVLLRGLAVEAEGWPERSWLFLSLCRQLGVDGGLLTFQPPGAKAPSEWTCGVLVDGKIYLFDTRLGMAIPGPGGKGVATLDEVLSDPSIIGRLDVHGDGSYRPNFETLKASKIGVLLDASPGYMTPRMHLLQESLAGRNRTVLYRDMLDQRDQFEKALGKQSGAALPWMFPMFVLDKLFHDGAFNQQTQQALFLFRPEFPLLYARVKQLRGELKPAIEDYMKFRLAEDPRQLDNPNKPIPPDVQAALDINATQFLALDHLEQGNLKQAEKFFNLTLKLVPAPGPRRIYCYYFRYGAQTNLGLLNEARGDSARAVVFYTADDTTPQHQGNLVRAHELIWRAPAEPPADPLPTPPPDMLTGP